MTMEDAKKKLDEALDAYEAEKKISNAKWVNLDDVLTHPYKIGENYLIRTVTMIEVGRLIAVYEQELVLEKASWVADTGRFNECLKEGKFNEVEMYHTEETVVGRGSIIDCVVYHHDLPTESK